MRQLIANGKSKAALDTAKDLHKRHPGPDTEALLVDAYCARIASLLDRKMAVEAESLSQLVRERFPAHASKLDRLAASAAACANSLDALVTPLKDAHLDPAKREAIESAVRRDVHDLAALAACGALPTEHPLRVAASALSRALNAATSGAVDPAALDLPEVSRRSPLAPWKPLIAAIACLYRGEDDRCREFLNTVAEDSAAARLKPAIRSALGDKPPAPLTPAAANLVTRIVGGQSSLRGSFEELDRAFGDDSDSQLLRRIAKAFEACRSHAPELAGALRQRVMVRSAIRDLDKGKTIGAVGGKPKEDFSFFRLFALGMEIQEEPESWGVANTLWDNALKHGVKEGLFKANGPEAAEIYVHMAGVIGKTPRRTLATIQRNAMRGEGGVEYMYFLFPEKLYGRAAAIDPRAEVFAPWLEWAKKEPGFTAENVAEAWRKASPDDFEPLLYLIEAKATRKAYNDALKYLSQAERIDGVHPAVRMQRARLLTGNFLNRLKRKNPRLAEETLDELAGVPATREGDRPAFLAALAWLGARVRLDSAAVNSMRKQVEDLLGGRVAAGILLCAISRAAKLVGDADIEPVERLTQAERASIPAGLARIFALCRYFGLDDARPPIAYVREAVKQLPEIADSLDLAQIQSLAELGPRGEFELRYAAAGAGMHRGGGREAAFLIMRAQSLPDWQEQRKMVCAAAAAELARERHDRETLHKAIEELHDMDASDFDLDLEEAREVLTQEKAAWGFPTRSQPGPDYSSFFGGGDVCQCADCRRRRGETEIDEDLPDFDKLEIPAGIPPELAKALLDEVRGAIARGESPDEFMERVLGPEPGPRKRKRK